VGQIPPRNSSKYAGHYAGTLGFQRMVEIFADSYQIALSSKNPDTAGDRFALAVEAYHQFMSMESSAEVRTSMQRAMEELVEFFPTQVVANEALGLREKAKKLKTPRKQLELLRRASEIVNRGLTEHSSSPVLQAAADEVRIEISQCNAAV
jgi:succinate dehydrogenase/fumarate reductase flavoprotein subunit